MKGKKPADIVGSVSDDKNPGEEPKLLQLIPQVSRPLTEAHTSKTNGRQGRESF
jgi:hypothetical protein